MNARGMRVKDVDFEANQLVVRAGKGDRDRVTLLPAIGRGALHRQLERVRVHDGDLREEVAGQLFYDDPGGISPEASGA